MSDIKGVITDDSGCKRLPPRKYRKIPIFSKPGYRIGYYKFWLELFDPRNYYYDLKTFWQRGRRGWADRDCWSIDHYLANWMGDALHHLQSKSHHVGTADDEGIKKFIIMIEAWDGAYHVLDSCDCLEEYIKDKKHSMSTKPTENSSARQVVFEGDWSGYRDYNTEHLPYYRRRWDYGIQVWVKEFFGLWW